MQSSVKKLWLKYEYHTLELEETQLEFKKRKAEFEFAFRKKYDKLPVAQKTTIDCLLSEQESAKPPPQPPSSAKRPEDDSTHGLFKEVAKHTHPDKYATRDEETRLEKAATFKRAKALADKGDWFGLYKVAQELGIDVPEPTEEECESVEKSIRQMQEKVQEMLKTAAWKWYDLDSDSRVKYMQAYYAEVFKLHEQNDA